MAHLILAAALAAGRPWEDVSLPVAARVAALIPHMSHDELLSQCRGLENLSLFPGYEKPGLGFANVKLFTRAEQVAMQAKVLKEGRWRIPVALFQEALHGGCTGSTVYPMPVNLGASFNVSLVEEVYDAVGLQTRACGAVMAFGPVINMFKDPRFGRHSEGFSSNPTLTSLYATAAAHGLQGALKDRPKGGYLPPWRVGALAKHFLGYGRPDGGLNGAQLSANEAIVRTEYLPPWRAFAAAGGFGVMPSHQAVLGVPMHANKYFLRDVLRGELNLPNALTLSDCNDISALQSFGQVRNASDALGAGLEAGMDVDLQCGKVSFSPENLADALARNKTSAARLREAAARVLHFKFATGLFDDPYLNKTVPPVKPDAPAQRALARRAATESLVLLQNTNAALPLPPAATRDVALIGHLADSGVDQLGPYTSLGAKVTTLEAALGDAGVQYRYAVGAVPSAAANQTQIDEAVAAATAPGTTAVVLMLGDDLRTCGEWKDRSSLDLPGGQYALLDAVIAARKAVDASARPPLVLVLASGRPATFGPANAQLGGVDAVLWSGRPGEEGGSAIWDVLTGAANPSGHLPSQWAKAVGHVGSGGDTFEAPVVGKWVDNRKSPPDADGRVYDSYLEDPAGVASPLFAFGHGLSYTSFAFESLTAAYSAAATELVVSFTVTNTGAADGAVAAQVYVVDPPHLGLVKAWKRFVGVAKVHLAKGASQQVTVRVGYDVLAVPTHDWTTRAWGRAITPGAYNVRVGASAATDSLNVNATMP